MKRQKNKKRKLKIICVSVCFMLCLISVLYCFSEYCQRQYSENVLRLHVIANSNSIEDQALKLKVRDVIGTVVSELACNADSAEETEKIVIENKDIIESAAEQIVKDEGYNYNVSVETGRFYFPTKYYNQSALPAGEYEAVRVVIGEGNGENWWCVLFPPLCFSNGNASYDMDQEAVNKDKGVTVKFKFVEFFQEAKNNIRMCLKIFKK